MNVELHGCARTPSSFRSVCLSVCLSSLYLCIDVWVFAIFSPVFLPLHSKQDWCYRDCAVHVENHHCTRSHAERAGSRGKGRAIHFEREIWAQTHTNRDAQTDRKTRTHTYTRARAHTHTHTGKCDKSFAQGKARDPWPLPLHGASELRLAIARGSCAGS